MINFLIGTYIAILWLIPVIFIVKKKLYDQRFVCRQWLFPLEFLFQLWFEKITSNSRIACRILHIITFIFSEFWLFLPLGFLISLGVDPKEHMEILLIIMYYFPIGSICFWFQPKAGKVYRTK